MSFFLRIFLATTKSPFLGADFEKSFNDKDGQVPVEFLDRIIEDLGGAGEQGQRREDPRKLDGENVRTKKYGAWAYGDQQ